MNLAYQAANGREQEVAKIEAGANLRYTDVARFRRQTGLCGAIAISSPAGPDGLDPRKSLDRARSCVRMNAVSLGPVETPILADLLGTFGEGAEEDLRIMDRSGRPTDLASVVFFPFSDGWVWLRGVNIATVGGMSAHIDATGDGLS